MEGFAEAIDRQWTLAINSLHTPATDFVWQVFSSRPLALALCAVVVAFLFVRLGWRKALVVTVACALCITCCDQLCNFVKATVGRLRPCHDPYMLERGLHMLEEPGGLYGFFSGHAANTLGFSVCSYMGFRLQKGGKATGYGIFAIGWAILTGISRVFVGKHFLGDVLVGFAAGLVIGLVFGALASLVAGRLKEGTKEPGAQSPS